MMLQSKLMFLLLISYLRVSSCMEVENDQDRDQIIEMLEHFDLKNARMLTDEDFLQADYEEEEEDFSQVEDLPSVNDGIEFIINLYEKGESLKQKMEEVTVKMDTTKLELAFQAAVSDKDSELKELYREIYLINQGRLVSTPPYSYSHSLSSALNYIENKKKKIIQKHAPIFNDLIKQNPTSKEVSAKFKEYRDTLDEYARFQDMHKHYGNYAMGLKKAIGLSDTGLVEMTRKGLKWDPKCLQDLLKLYQKLEGLKNQALLEKDEDSKKQKDLDILKLEKEISIYVKENQEDLNNYSVPLVVGKGVVDRTYSKMVAMVEKMGKHAENYIRSVKKQDELSEKFDKMIRDARASVRNEEL